MEIKITLTEEMIASRLSDNPQVLSNLLTALYNLEKGFNDKSLKTSAENKVEQTVEKKVEEKAEPVETKTVQPSTPTIPTSAPTYSIEDLQTAAVKLIDKGKMSQLQALLSEFGVVSLPELPDNKTGAFALRLRELGADI